MFLTADPRWPYVCFASAGTLQVTLYRVFALWSGKNSGDFRYQGSQRLAFQRLRYYRFKQGVEVRVDEVTIS